MTLLREETSANDVWLRRVLCFLFTSDTMFAKPYFTDDPGDEARRDQPGRWPGHCYGWSCRWPR